MSVAEKALGLVAPYASLTAKGVLDVPPSKVAILEKFHRVSVIARNRLLLLNLASVVLLGTALYFTALPLAATVSTSLLIGALAIAALYYHLRQIPDSMVALQEQQQWLNFYASMERALSKMSFNDLKELCILKTEYELDFKSAKISEVFKKRFLELCTEEKLGWEKSIAQYVSMKTHDDGIAITMEDIRKLTPTVEEQSFATLPLDYMLVEVNEKEFKTAAGVYQLIIAEKLRVSPPKKLEDLKSILIKFQELKLLQDPILFDLACNYALRNPEDIVNDTSFTWVAREIIREGRIDFFQESELEGSRNYCLILKDLLALLKIQEANYQKKKKELLESHAAEEEFNKLQVSYENETRETNIFLSIHQKRPKPTLHELSQQLQAKIQAVAAIHKS